MTTMKNGFSIALAAAVTMAAARPPLVAADGPQIRPLRVLYVGNAHTDRGRSYARFLGETFTLKGAVDRSTFEPGSLPEVDVIVLDWSQSDIVHTSNPRNTGPRMESDVKSPLGQRSRWTKPTVLLGSAGHLLAAPWKVFGGSG
jgi:hypothetical protein